MAVAAFVDHGPYGDRSVSAEHLFKFIQVNDHLLYHIFSHPVEEEPHARRLLLVRPPRRDPAVKADPAYAAVPASDRPARTLAAAGYRRTFL